MICNEIEKLDGKAKFKSNNWKEIKKKMKVEVNIEF